MRTLLAAFICSLTIGLCQSTDKAPTGPRFKALVFSKTTLFRHDSIPNGIEAIKKLADENSFAVEATEDATVFNPENLKNFKVIIFLNTSGDLFTSEQESTFRNWMEAGGSLVGVHAAIPGKDATEGSWKWYTELFCTEFHNHPEIADALIHVENRAHPSTRDLPEQWRRTDEWYNFKSSPRQKVNVLATLKENTYKGGTMGDDHPIVWWRDDGKARVWYTALGHTAGSYTEPLYLKHLLGGILFAARLEEVLPPAKPNVR